LYSNKTIIYFIQNKSVQHNCVIINNKRKIKKFLNIEYIFKRFGNNHKNRYNNNIIKIIKYIYIRKKIFKPSFYIFKSKTYIMIVIITTKKKKKKKKKKKTLILIINDQLKVLIITNVNNNKIGY